MSSIHATNTVLFATHKRWPNNMHANLPRTQGYIDSMTRSRTSARRHPLSPVTEKRAFARTTTSHSKGTQMRTTVHLKIPLTLMIMMMLSSIAGAAEESPLNETVKYGDLDLSRPSGVKALYQRIEAASGRVCEERPTTTERDLGRWAEIRHCKADSIRRTVASIGNVALTQYFAAHDASGVNHLTARTAKR